MFPPQNNPSPPSSPFASALGGAPPMGGTPMGGTPMGGLPMGGPLSQPPAIDPQLIQLLLAQMEADGLEGGMQPEQQQMIPSDPTADQAGMLLAMGMSTMGGMPGMGMPGMGMPGMPALPAAGSQLPPAFLGAQQLASQRPQVPPQSPSPF